MRDKLRALASDTAVYGVSTIVQRFLTFMLTPLYTNYLTMSELGVVSNIYALIAFVNILYACGFESAFMRFYRGTDSEKRIVFTQSFLPVVIVSALLSLLFFLARSVSTPFTGLPSATDSSEFALILSIPFLDALTIIPFALLRMERRAARFAVFKIIVVILNIILNVILVVYYKMGSHGVFVAGACSSLLAVILVAPIIMKSLERGISRLKELTSFGIPTIPSGFASMLLQVADRPILTAMTTPIIVGLYNANYRLAIPMMLCVSVFEYAWKPFYLHHADDKDASLLFGRIFTYFTLVSATVFFMISVFAPLIVQIPFPGGTLIHASYWQGLHIVPIVAAAYFFAGVTSNLAAGLHITKNTKQLPLIVGLAAVVNIILNLILIPTMSYTGAAWATLGAYLVSAGFMYTSSQRVYKVHYEWGRVGVIVALAVVFLQADIYLCSHEIISKLMAEFTPTSSSGLVILLVIKTSLLLLFGVSLTLARVVSNSGNGAGQNVSLRSLFRRMKA